MKIRYGRNDFIENDALNFVFYLIDDQQHLRLDDVLMNIYEITHLPHDIIMKVIDLYNQRSQFRKEYLTGRLFTCSFLEKAWAEYYQSEINKIEAYY